MSNRPTLLILSFSPIASDARVLKQVARFTGNFDVTTCGYGPAPQGVVEHISIPVEQRYDDLNGRLITLRQYRTAYWHLSAVTWSRQHLAGRRFDVAIANDVEAVPVALELYPAHGVLADLHEYSPRLHDDNEAWHRRITPWFEWLCRHYVSRASSWTTVSRGIVEEYEKQFGFRPQLVTNAAPFFHAHPTPVSTPIRLVHSGACLRNRQLRLMSEAVISASADVTLDFYLTPNDPVYLHELKTQAESTDRVTVHEPVPYADLARTLNRYDVGVFVLPPQTFNYRHALPNKLFDYVQARLGVVIGPSVEMAYFVDKYQLGVVADDFTMEATKAALESLTVETVTGFKANAAAAAGELASDKQVDVWENLINTQMRGVQS